MLQDDLKLRVLVVEDAWLTADQVRESLLRQAYIENVLIVATEKEALSVVAEFAPDVVILDLKLKQGTGFGVLRALASTQSKPVMLVLTNYALPQYREFALLNGADYFLDKAIDLEMLPAIVESIARKREFPSPSIH